ncbi:NAD kinase [Gammaproteobacteria bacterium]
MLPKFRTVIIVRKVNNPNDPFIVSVAASITAILHDHYPTVDVIDVDPNLYQAEQENFSREFEERQQRGRHQDSKVLFIAIGGDGTVLTAARYAVKNNDYLIGINTGNLGFLTEFDPHYAASTILDIFRGIDIFVERRSALKCRLGDNVYYAMNDFVISDAESDRAITYSLSINNDDRNSHAGTHSANSVIISSPTGSTAYALNVGGAILSPDLDVLQILPIAPMSITSRPLIVGGHNKIVVNVKPKRSLNTTHWVSVKGDGQKISQLDSYNGLTFVFESCKDYVNMIHYKTWCFFDVLREKLFWNRPHF